MVFRPYGPGTPPAQELAARAAEAAGLQPSSHQSSGVASERRAAEDEGERASLMQALAGVEGHYERLVGGAYWVSQQPAYRENPDRGVMRSGWADPERLLFAELWPDGIPSTFPDPARPWDLYELGHWFAETASARGIVLGPKVERRHESRGRSGKLRVNRSREPAWTIRWVVGARSEKPGQGSVKIFADGQMQFDAWDHHKRVELGGLASMARRLGFPEERAVEKTGASGAGHQGVSAPSRKTNDERNAKFRAREIEKSIEARRETLELIPKTLAACSALRAQGCELHDPDGPEFRWVDRGHSTRPHTPFAWRIGGSSFGRHIIVPIRWGHPTIHVQASEMSWYPMQLKKLERHFRGEDTIPPHVPATLREVIALITEHLARRERGS